MVLRRLAVAGRSPATAPSLVALAHRHITPDDVKSFVGEYEIRKVPQTWRDMVRRNPHHGDAHEIQHELHFPEAGESSFTFMSEPISQRLTALSHTHKPEPERRFEAVRELWNEGKISDDDSYVLAMDTLSEIQHDVPEAIGLMAILTSDLISTETAIQFLRTHLNDVEHAGYDEALSAFVELTMTNGHESGLNHMRAFLREEIVEKKRASATRIYGVLGDSMMQGLIRNFHAKGEGAGTRYVVDTMRAFSKEFGEVHTVNILTSALNIAGELLFDVDAQAGMKNAGGELSEETVRSLGPIICFHKAVVTMKWLAKIDIKAEFRSMYHLFNALKMAKRTTEAHQIGERLIASFEKNRANLVPEDEDRYRLTMFQMCSDKFQARRDLGKRFLYTVIEKVPDASVPWRFLALEMMHEKRWEDALIAIKKAISLNPLDDSSLLVLVQIYEELGRLTLRDQALELARLADSIKLREEAARAEQQQQEGLSGESEAQLAETTVTKQMISNVVNSIDEAALEEPDHVAETQKDWKQYLELMRAHHIYGYTGKRTPRTQQRPLQDRIFEYHPDAWLVPGMGPKETDKFLDTDPVLLEQDAFHSSSRIRGAPK